MPLRVQINYAVAAATPEERERLDALLAEHAEAPSFRRLPGISRTGPCPICIPYLHTVHDGSGTIVPLIPLHDGCVCRDVPEILYRPLPGAPERVMQPGEWMRTDPAGQQVFERAVGSVRTSLVRSGVVPEGALFQRPPKTGLVNVATLTRRIARSPERVSALAEALGVKPSALSTPGRIAAALRQPKNQSALRAAARQVRRMAA